MTTQLNPATVEPVIEAPAFDAHRLLTDDERRHDELIALRAEVSRLQAANRIAVRHLDKVLNGCNSHKVNPAETEARDWLQSIGEVT